nr:death-associated protein-like 1 [Anolis sagrei ordinatus]
MAQVEVSAPLSPLKGGHSPAVKAGGMRVSKKVENAPAEKKSKLSGKEKTKGHLSSSAGNTMPSSVNVLKMQSMGVLLADTLEKFAHKLPPAASQVAHQKPRPTVEKTILPKRMYIIQQPSKC